MSDAVVAQKAPFKVSVKAGRTYWWCACGRSRNQPFCDGSHKGTGFEPVSWKAEAVRDVWFCGCKQTSGRPFCDGTHKRL